MQDQEQRKDYPWLPALLPLAAFGVVAIILPALGMFFLTINYATADMFHAPWPHSTAVIVVALTFAPHRRRRGLRRHPPRAAEQG